MILCARFHAVIVVCLLLGTGGVCAQTGQDARALFEQGQKFHLGLDVPVDYSKAFVFYRQAIDKDPNFKDAYYNMAHICQAQKRYDLAVGYYERVIRIDPNDSDAYNNLGTVLLRQGETDKAKRAYAKAIQLNKELALAYYNLTIIFMKEGDQARAEKAIGEAVRLEPDNEDFVKMQSKIMGEEGKISDWWALVAFGGFGGIVVGYYWLFARKGV